MKSISRYALVVIVLASLLLGACTGAPATGGAGKVEASPVAYTGIIESINGNQWVVNGLAITVDPSVIRDGPFNVGDAIKVEVDVKPDGTFTVTRVEVPSSTDLSELPPLGDDNSNGNANDDNTNAVNSNDDNSNGNLNDDNTNINSNENANDDSGYSNDNNSNDDNSNGNDNSNDANSNGSGNENGGGGGGGNDSGGGNDDGGGGGGGGDDGGNSNS